MKAKMEVTLDTIWTNQVTASVECEFDNPHVVTAEHLAEMMVHRLKFMVEEIREANRRAIPALDELQEPRPRLPAQVDPLSGEPERERQAYEEMRAKKNETTIPQHEHEQQQ